MEWGWRNWEERVQREGLKVSMWLTPKAKFEEFKNLESLGAYRRQKGSYFKVFYL
jgi:hypothetical protein